MSKLSSITTTEKEDERIVKSPNQNDIFLGRGGNMWRKEGNNRLRNICQQWNHKYNSVPKAKKPMIAKTIVDQVKAMEPPGRFLKKRCESSGVSDIAWEEVDDSVAIEKVSQLFRDIRRTPRSRNSSRSMGACRQSYPVLMSPFQRQENQYPSYGSPYAATNSTSNSTLTSCTDDKSLALGGSPSSPPPSLIAPSPLDEAQVFLPQGDVYDGSSDKSAHFSSSNSVYRTRYREEITRTLDQQHQSSHSMNTGATLNFSPSSPQSFSSSIEREQCPYHLQWQRHNGSPQHREVFSSLYDRNNIPGITATNPPSFVSDSLVNNSYTLPSTGQQHNYYNYNDEYINDIHVNKNRLQQQQQVPLLLTWNS